MISLERRGELLQSAQEILKVELRDNYAADAGNFAAWRTGGFAGIAEVAQQWADTVASDLTEGRTWRRVRVVSEPLSEYQRYAYDFAGPAVAAGEDMRYLPRRLVSVLPLPGNDCFVLDGEVAMFNVLDGRDDRAEFQVYRDSEAVKFCRDAVTAAFAMAIPHHEYQP
ncbi:hypothetical protein J4573_38140 [Actinomadura barringtoniae]|uniref:DUF6879 domain-containing protein n=1 Tax=Actinomadura barringtoniae TaxID=1427535 RepID=A0A939T8B7_9ACTN|nr:DUF6879 family protein [Actinomadura barringtoniae]MBO2452964.1 hypothetical protein [Actinomadura barringtoniae]